MNDEDAVGRQVHVELDAVDPEGQGRGESGERVLRVLSGKAAVGDDLGTVGHAVSAG
jgi:hypothetical protein